MKKIKAIIVVLAIISVFILSFNSCELGLTKELRIAAFLDDLNQNPRSDSMRYHFHPSAGQYDTIVAGTFNDFTTLSIPYVFSSMNYSGNPVTGMVMGSTIDFSAAPLWIEFTMEQDGINWLILKLEVQNYGVIVQ
jgi:hypothetical protein